MRKISKGDIPEFWERFIRRNPTTQYKQIVNMQGGKEIISNLHTHLKEEQGNVCAYCCCHLVEGQSHNEHIKPESRYQNQTMDYFNIVASCTRKLHSSNSSCGRQKDNNYDEQLFVSPLEEGCERNFTYYTDGSIDWTSPRGEYTIKLLRLHESAVLKKERSAQYLAVYNLCHCEVEDIYDSEMDEDEEVYEIGKAVYDDFFLNNVVPVYFTKQNGQWPAFIDMLEYFRREGFFSFDSLVEDVKLQRETMRANNIDQYEMAMG